MNEDKSTRILLVDDEYEFLQTLSERLKMRGFRVDIALNGEDALEKLSHRLFDVIFVDLLMPNMDGLETTRRIKELNPSFEVIILTGHGSIRSGVDAMKMGVCDFMEKPVEINAMVEKVRMARDRFERSQRCQTETTLTRLATKQGW